MREGVDDMAQSKNNRKKGRKKNNKSRAAQTTKNVVPTMRDWDKEKKIRFACLGVMIVGFVLALIDNRITSLIGYPLAFIGAAASMVNTQWDTTNHKITKIVLCVFCMLCAMQFVLLIMGNG